MMGIREFFRGKIAENDRLTGRDIQKEWNSGTDQQKKHLSLFVVYGGKGSLDDDELCQSVSL